MAKKSIMEQAILEAQEIEAGIQSNLEARKKLLEVEKEGIHIMNQRTSRVIKGEPIPYTLEELEERGKRFNSQIFEIDREINSLNEQINQGSKEF